MRFTMAIQRLIGSLGVTAAWVTLKQDVLPILRRMLGTFQKSDGPIFAAAIAYYTLLSIFPLVLGLVALAGALIGSSDLSDRFIRSVAQQFPGSATFIESTLRSIIRNSDTAGLVAIVGLIWSGSGVFGAISQALDRIYGVRRSRGLIASSLVALALVVGVGLLFIASLLLSTVLRIAFETQLPIDGLSLSQIPLLYPLVGTLLPLLVTIFAFGFLYRFVPSVPLPWGRAWPGAVAAGVAFELAKQLFSFYLTVAPDFNAVYGALGAVIVLLIWANYAANVILFSAAFNVALAVPPAGEQETSQQAA